jgi:antitoxin component of RelBE/YafQ-DinJ toxin-antitoxin module
MGLSVSYAVRMLLKRVVDDQAFALELRVPDAQEVANPPVLPHHETSR